MSPVEAREMLQVIAEAEAATYTELGHMAEEGIGEAVDHRKACKLYRKASHAWAAALRLAGLSNISEGRVAG